MKTNNHLAVLLFSLVFLFAGTFALLAADDSSLEFELYATTNGLIKITEKAYLDGLDDGNDNFFDSCKAYGDGKVIVKITMGSYVDYLKLVSPLCKSLTNVGEWYFHSKSADGPWKAVNGNHSALLGGWTPYGDDSRTYGTFWGAPSGPTGYHAEGGGCCHAEPGDNYQMWRPFKMEVAVIEE